MPYRLGMPELPEVETVARDLRPLIVGATIVGARCSWARTLRTHTPEAFAEAVAGRRIEAVGRRAKLVVIDLSGDAALTIHLKMTGQLFVVPADAPMDPYVRLVLELADGREIRFRDIRKFGKVGLYGRDPVTGELVPRSAGRRCSPRSVPSRSIRRSPCASSGAPAAAVGPAQAAPARPVVRGRCRQHLRRRGAVDGPPPPAPDGRHAAARRRAPAVRGAADDPGRGHRATRQLDRRLHRARRRRLDAGAAAGLPADRRAVSALRAAGQADRHRRPVHPFLLVVPAVGSRGPQGRDGHPADDDRRAAASRRPLDRAGRGGDRRPDTGRGGARRDPRPDRANETGRGDAPGRGTSVGRRGSQPR